MDIIVFALVVTLDQEPEPWVASYWMRLQHCLSDARLLSRREDNYAAVLAVCKPVRVNPTTIDINGYEKKPQD